MYLLKKSIHSVQWGPGQTQEAGEFCVKSNLRVCNLLLTASYRHKIGGAECTSCSPNNFLGGATAFPALPVPAPMVK